ARSLINQPTLVLGDEPTGNLDTETGDHLLAMMKRMNRDRGVTYLIVTHDLDIAAETDRQVRLRDGRVVADSKAGTAATPAAPYAWVQESWPTPGKTVSRGSPPERRSRSTMRREWPITTTESAAPWKIQVGMRARPSQSQASSGFSSGPQIGEMAAKRPGSVAA